MHGMPVLHCPQCQSPRLVPDRSGDITQTLLCRSCRSVMRLALVNVGDKTCVNFSWIPYQ